MTSPPEWTVLYHAPGKFKGRGEFLRLMLEDAGVAYVNSGEHLYGPTSFFDVLRGSLDSIKQDKNDDESNKQDFPMLFPPAIWHCPTSGGETVLINQAAACMMYIGDQLGYAPTTSAEKARADCITLNAMDYIADGRRSFHPVEDKMSYSDQKEEGNRVSKEFTKDRMLKYLYHFEKVVLKHGPNMPVAGGKNLTYADFALWHVLDATIHQFNTDFYDMVWDMASIPTLKAYHTWIKERPNLKAYFASDRCAPFAGDSMM